ncbi:MAG: ATP synthase F1 subunit epsilon [Oscillospiraceae bacterium]|nr:ATP synthase F1 subunit epsilon [Oscillospiraceae bacterium]
MNTFKLDVLAAEKPFYSGECISLVFPANDGQYGIQANHSNMVAAVVPGELSFTAADGTKTIAAVSSGIIKVEDNTVVVLVDTAERPEEIDENRARRAVEQAKEALLQKKSISEYYAAQAEISRAMSRLKVKNHKI